MSVTSAASTALLRAAARISAFPASAANQRSEKPGGGKVRNAPEDTLSSATTASGESRTR